jgi:hypothetical protein
MTYIADASGADDEAAFASGGGGGAGDVTMASFAEEAAGAGGGAPATGPMGGMKMGGGGPRARGVSRSSIGSSPMTSQRSEVCNENVHARTVTPAAVGGAGGIADRELARGRGRWG